MSAGVAGKESWRSEASLTARCKEKRVGEFDVRKPPHVAEVYDMREDAQEREEDGEPVNDA